jgi:type I restriction enzyme S subunit
MPRNSNVDKKSYEGQRQVRLCNYTDVYYNERISPDLPFMSATASDEEIETFMLRQGDVIITKDSETSNDIGIPAHVEEDMPDVVCGYHLCVLRPFNVTGEFLFRAMQSRPTKAFFNVEASGVTRYGLGQDTIKDVLIPLPPREEQRRICDWIDRETARIDALIEKKTRFIELLREKRQALITRTVTKGLNVNVSLKPSGADWLGSVPTHWTVKPLKLLVKPGSSVTYGIVQPGEHSTDGVPFVQTTNISRGEFAIERLQRASIEIEAQYPRSRLLGGEVILGIRASIGAAYIVTPCLRGANLSRGVARIDCSSELSPQYLVQYLRSHCVANYWELSRQGSTFSEVSIDTV